MEKIQINKEKRNGTPCIRDTRIAVKDILGYLAAGMSFEEIIKDFPSLSQDDIKNALEYAQKQL